MQNFIKNTILALSLAIITPNTAFAGEAEAMQALKLAINDVKLRGDKYKNIRFSFRKKTISREDVPKEMEEAGEEAEITEYIYYPDKPIAQRFSILNPSHMTNSKQHSRLYEELVGEENAAIKTGEMARLADRALLFFDGSDNEDENGISDLQDSARYLRETSEFYVFDFTPDNAEMNIMLSDDEDGKMSKKDKKIAERMAKAMRGEFYLRKADNQLDKLHLWLSEPVKMGKGIKIKKMDINMHLAPITEGGPLIISRTYTNVKVKVVLFSVKMNETETISDIKISSH